MLAVLTAVVFAATSLAVYGLLDLVFADDRRVSRRLRHLTVYEQTQALEAQPMLRPFADRVLKPAGATITRIARALFPTSHRQSLRVRLAQAGYPGGLDADRFFAAQIMCLVGGSVLVLTLGLIAGSRFGPVLFVALIAGLVGFFGPDLWLRGKRAARKRAVIRQLPDMLDMLTISVEAGLGFDQALAKLVRSSRTALSEEFGRMLQEVQAGASRKEALRHLAERVDVSAVSTFVASIIQADMFGVSVARVLRTQAAEMRLKRRQHAEEEAQRAPVKMVIPLVLCILPATMIVILGPAVVRIGSLFGM